MKASVSFLLSLILALIVLSCQNALSSGTNTLNGQVLLISYPGPQPIGWIPPPLQEVNVVQILNEQRRVVREVATDATGRFHLSLAPNSYYLRVKNSPLPVETGPYVLQAGHVLVVEAHYDNGLR